MPTQEQKLGTLLAALEEAIDALDREAIPYVLCGGFAVAARGRPRFTQDVDLLVKPSEARPALAALEKAGFQTEETNPHWIFKAFRNGALVDLLFKSKGDVYLDDEMIARATLEKVHGVDVRVIPREDLIVIKALVHDEETPRHWWDALSVVAAGGVDWDYLLRRAVKGPRRVLSLLHYATSLDLVVPAEAIERLHAGVLR
ncbi:MAG TPA: nucleotidyl transferase AbiEii/AbiGii toxin family protein [Candidatus Polarisedimenticolaceae bacterium]|nr:nucleotidyl transferase AbiEii/AbiGii toxin family protein [Candidatus Polarisedimenticolaceae bacterium]